MRLARLLKIAAAAAIVAVVTAEAWSLAKGYRDARVCLDSLPAVEETGEIVIGTLARPHDLPGVFEIGYRVNDTIGSRPGRLRCAFGDGPDGLRHLVGMEFGGRSVGEARLYFLKRFWLGDPAAVRSGAARLTNDVPPLAVLAAIVDRPHPSLIGALLCALLAVAALAAGWFARGGRQG